MWKVRVKGFDADYPEQDVELFVKINAKRDEIANIVKSHSNFVMDYYVCSVHEITPEEETSLEEWKYDS